MQSLKHPFLWEQCEHKDDCYDSRQLRSPAKVFNRLSHPSTKTRNISNKQTPSAWFSMASINQSFGKVWYDPLNLSSNSPLLAKKIVFKTSVNSVLWYIKETKERSTSNKNWIHQYGQIRGHRGRKSFSSNWNTQASGCQQSSFNQINYKRWTHRRVLWINRLVQKRYR